MLRKLLWAGAAGLLMLPAVAMRFTTEVEWTLSDFVFMGVLLTAAASAVEVGMRLSGDWYYRLGVLAAVGGSFLTVWVNAAVGMIGSEDEAVNLAYLGVILVALVGSILARFRAAGMARAMFAALALHVGIGIAALVLDLGDIPARVIGVTAVFSTPWLLAGALLRAAAQPAREGSAA
jgi:hypothetical protein